MIFQRQTERSLGFRGQLAVLLTAFLTVPLLPGWAQDIGEAESAPPPVAEIPVAEIPLADAMGLDTPDAFPGLDRPPVAARAPRPVDLAEPTRPGNPRAPLAPSAPRPPRALVPGQRGPVDQPSPAEVARAVELAVALLIEADHHHEAKLLIDLANSAADAPVPTAMGYRSGSGQDVGAVARFPGGAPGRATPGQLAASRGSRAPGVASAQGGNPFLHRDRTVRVRAGDSLAQLAEKYYGDRNLWFQIARANDLAEGETIRVGDRLIIPAQPGVTKRSTRTPRAVDAAEPAPRGLRSAGGRSPRASDGDRIQNLEDQLRRMERTLERLMHQLEETKEAEPRSDRRRRGTRGMR